MSRIYVWGSASHGALGNPESVLGRHVGKRKKKYLPPHPSCNQPTRCSRAEQFKIKDVAAGYGYSVFAAGSYLLGTGLNKDGQIGYHEIGPDKAASLIIEPVKVDLPTSSTVARVEAGRSHTLALTSAREVFSLGNNAYGQCGRPVVEDEDYFRSRVVHRVRFEELPENDSIVDICAGIDHSLFVSDQGRVFSCGWSADGQTGLQHYDNQHLPALIEGDVKGEVVKKVACAADCVLALNNRGEVFGWGNSEYGQFQTVTTEQQLSHPTRLSLDVGKIIDIASGGSICMVMNGKRVT